MAARDRLVRCWHLHLLDEMTDISIYLGQDTGHTGFPMDAELISIIIPSLNEERHIGMALQSIKEQGEAEHAEGRFHRSGVQPPRSVPS